MSNAWTHIATILLAASLASGAFAALPEKPQSIDLKRGDAALQVLPERQVIRFLAPPRPLGLEGRAQLLHDLAGDYFRDHPAGERYALTVGHYPEFNARMAGIASCSPQWDALTGRVKSGSASEWLRGQLEKGNAYSELVRVFDDLGYKIEIGGLESIALCGPGKIDWSEAQRSCKTPISLRSRLPCGALVTFTLTQKRPNP